MGWTEQWCCVLPESRQGLLENRLFLVCVWCVCMHVHTRSFNQSYELLQQCQSTADRALLHLSFWGLSLLGSFITRVNCCETWFHLSSVFLLGLPSPQFFLVKKNQNKKTVTVLFIWKNALFTFLILQSLSAWASVSVFFLHWLHMDFVLDLKCTLSSLPQCVCCSCQFRITKSLQKECFTTLILTLWAMVQKTLVLPMFLPGLAIRTWENVKNVWGKQHVIHRILYAEIFHFKGNCKPTNQPLHHLIIYHLIIWRKQQKKPGLQNCILGGFLESLTSNLR